MLIFDDESQISYQKENLMTHSEEFLFFKYSSVVKILGYKVE